MKARELIHKAHVHEELSSQAWDLLRGIFCTRSPPMGVMGHSLTACPSNLQTAPESAMSAVQRCGQERRRDLMPREGGGDSMREGYATCNGRLRVGIQWLGQKSSLLL